MNPLMTVGEFALATGLSAKALRFYGERGLLAPADVDADPASLPARLEAHVAELRRRRDLEDRALADAGLGPAGPLWTAIRPFQGAADVVDTVLAVPLPGPAPADLAVPGLTVVTGTLPRRVERYVAARVDAGDVELLDDAPGGALPHPALLDLMDTFDAEDVGAAAEVRQILVDPEAGRVELAVTVREAEGAGRK